MSRVWLFVYGAFVLLFALLAWGLIASGGSPLHDETYRYDYKQGLALTQEQLVVFRDIVHDYRVQNRLIQSDYARLFVLNHNLFDNDEYDVDYYKQESLKIEQQRLALEEEFFTKIHMLLTKEQRKAFAESIDEWSIRR